MGQETTVYVELHSHSCFTFLDGAVHPEDLVARAAELGYRALALTDRDGLYAAVRFARAAKEAGIRPVIGAEVTLGDGHHLTLLARTDEGYANLSALVSAGRMAAPKGEARVPVDALGARARGLVALSGCPGHGEIARALERGDVAAARAAAGRLRDIFGRDAFYLEVQDHLTPGEARLRVRLRAFGRRLRIPLVVTNDVHYLRPEDRDLADILTCIRHGVPLAAASALLRPNAEWCLKPPEEVARRFADLPEALRRTVEIAESCDVSVERLRYRFPSFPLPEGPPGREPWNDATYLRHLVAEGARARYAAEGAVPEAVARQLEHELAVIERLGLPGYFLVVHDIARFCRERDILAQGRGSAANSAVCYCLGITAVDPVKLGLLFERFLSEERKEAPDIDLDIANADREQVIQHVYERYGRDRAGMVCELITYRGRSALRDVGKALGLSLEQVDRLATALDAHDADEADVARSAAEAGISGSFGRRLGDLVRRIEGFPRHLSIHVGGFVISSTPLAESVPIENAAMPGRTVIQWDKDDCADAGLIKIDLLGLGMLTLLSLARRLIERHRGIRLDLARLDHRDPRVYDLLCAADTVGVFQVESRAQMQCLPRLKPRCFYDLVVEVALIRPGPIQGAMVHPYLRRRAGEEPVTYPHPKLEPVLARTLGVPLFQEQSMQVAMIAGGFTGGEADELRRAMGHKRSHERMAALAERLIDGMERHGIEREAAERIVKQLAAFADYGFPESHAASFALLVYASAFVKVYHAPEFYCALLNAQPMGFYAPATIVNDARRHDVPIRGLDVTRSRYDCTLEPCTDGPHGFAVRIGLRYARDVGETAKARLDGEADRAPFASIDDFGRRAGLGPEALRSVALAGGFDAFGLGRRAALFRALAVARAPPLPLAPAGPDPSVPLPPASRVEEAAGELFALGLSTRFTALDLLASERRNGIHRRAADLREVPDGAIVNVIGAVICRQRPGTARGMVFLTLEDETGLANVVVRPDRYERFRAAVRGASVLEVEGKLERKDGVTNIVLRSCRTIPLGVKAVRAREWH